MLFSEMESEVTEKRRQIRISWKAVLLAAVLAALVGVSIYFYSRFQHSQALLKDPVAATREETNNLISKVGRHIQLPAGEVPTIAKVSDVSQLKDQPFFANAQPGDTVLIYVTSGKAILYRPEIDKIIEITTVNLGQEVAGTSTVSAQLQSASLTILNGTNTKGLAGEAEEQITSRIPALQPITKTNAKGNYKETMVVILNSAGAGNGNKTERFVEYRHRLKFT